MARSYKELVDDLQFTHYRAPQRKYEERILIIHYFGGHQGKLKRHIRFLNDLGFDVYGFNLSYSKNWVYKKFPKLTKGQWRLSNIWDNEVEEVAAYIPGPIITYSFSGPAACAVHLAANSGNHKVKALVSDSGPFSHIVKCSYNLAGHEFKLGTHFTKYLGSWILSFLWNPYHTKELLKDMSEIREGTPYLSIQPEKDRIVNLEYMQDVFKRSPHKLKLTNLSLAHSGHLNGIVLEKEKYKKEVADFLQQIACPI